MESSTEDEALADLNCNSKNSANPQSSDASSSDDYTFAYALLSLRARSDESCVLLSGSSSKQTSSEACTVVEGVDSNNDLNRAIGKVNVAKHEDPFL